MNAPLDSEPMTQQEQDEGLASLAVFSALQTLRSGWSEEEYERQLRHFGFEQLAVKSAFPAEKHQHRAAIEVGSCPF